MYKKKSEGFTLIELLAVIALLALVALIAYPIVINSVKKTGKKLSKEQINNIEDAARDYAIKHGPEECSCISIEDLQTGGYLDKGKISDPDTGEQLNGYVTIEWVESQSQYSYKYGENCNCSGTSVGGQIQLVLSVDPGVIKESGWATSTFDVNVRGKNITGYSYCISSTGECTPNTKVIGTKGTIPVTKDGTNYVCAQGTNGGGDGSVVCKTYKLDISGPVFASESVYFDNYGKTEDYVNVNYGTVRCDKTISQLTSDTNKVSCTVTSDSGKKETKELNFIANTLKADISVASSNTTFLGGTLKRNQVKGIYIVDHKTIPSDATSWDVSHHQNGSVMAWYGAPDSNGLYDVYIGQNGGVVAKSGNYLFNWFDHATTLDVSKLDTSKVTGMKQMFYKNQATTITGLNKLNTSKVTTMEKMFSNTGATALDVSSFDTGNVTTMTSMFASSKATSITGLNKFKTSKVTTMSHMFNGSQASTLDVSSFNTSNVTLMHNMFYNTRATSITGLNNFNTSKVTNMTSMFSNTNTTTLDVSSFDTSKVTSMTSMFSNSKATTITGLNNLNTSNVTGMSYMFSNSSVTTLDLRNFNTSKVTSMSYMFQNSKATTFDISSFNTSNVTTMENMFYGFKASTLDLRNFNTSKVTGMDRMFMTSQITNLDLSSFDMSNVNSTTNLFLDAKITTGYARTQADADKLNSSSNKPATFTFTVK